MIIKEFGLFEGVLDFQVGNKVSILPIGSYKEIERKFWSQEAFITKILDDHKIEVIILSTGEKTIVPEDVLILRSKTFDIESLEVEEFNKSYGGGDNKLTATVEDGAIYFHTKNDKIKMSSNALKKLLDDVGEMIGNVRATNRWQNIKKNLDL